MSHARFTFGVVSLTALLWGCGNVHSPSLLGAEQNAVSRGAPIGAQGGQAGEGGGPAYVTFHSVAKDNAVVYLYHPNPDTFCTGTVISPHVVITALHCLAENKGTGTFNCSPEGELLQATTPEAGTLGAVIDPTTLAVRVGTDAPKIAAHGKRIFDTGAHDVCTRDIAAIVVDKPIDVPFFSIRLDGESKRLEQARIVGYGALSDAQNDVNGRNERDDMTIYDVGPSGTSPPGWLLTGEGPCHGDSGGPLISLETNAVIGVCSLNLQGTCTGTSARNAYTQTQTWQSVIQNALDEAGEEAIREVVPGTGGSGNTGQGGAATGQAGATGDAGAGAAVAEGGAVNGSGGDSATGGSVAAGGSGAKGGTGGSSAKGGGSSGGTGGTATGGTGNDAATGGGDSTGSGSRRDPACTCRTAGSMSGSSLAHFAGLLLAAGAVLRRRRSRSAH